MGMMSEIPIASQGPKEVEAQLLQDAERNAAYFDKIKPWYTKYIGPGPEKTWNMELGKTRRTRMFSQ